MVTALSEQAQTYDGSTPLDNAQHEDLCNQYVIDNNGQKAGERSGYSPKSARSQVSDLLTKPNIKLRVAYLRGLKAVRAQKTADDIIREIEHVAFSRLGNIMTFNQSGASFVHSPETLPDSDHAAIESIEVKEDHYGNGDGAVMTTKVKLHSKMKALEMLSRQHNVCQPNGTLVLNGDSLLEGIHINFVSVKKESE